MVGYKQQWIRVNHTSQIPLVVEMESSASELQEVSVVAHKLPIQNRGERMIVNLDSYMQTKGKNSIDVLRILPGVISERESFSLMGKAVAVYINDKPSNLSGAGLINYLSTLSGDQINKVELMANPSARFGAGYNDAIINIKLKKNASLGYNGSISNTIAAWGKNRYETPSLNLNYRSRSINIYGGYSYRHNQANNIIDYIRRYKSLDSPVQYNENGNSNMRINYHSYNVGLDYIVSNRHELGLLIKGSANDFKNSNNTKTGIQKIGFNQVDSLIVSPIEMKIKSYNNQINLAHKWNMDTIGTTLTTNINYMNIYGKNIQRIPLYYKNVDGTTSRESDGSGQDVKQDMNLWTTKIDLYRKFLKDGSLDAGIKYDNIKRTNDLFALSFINETWVGNPVQNNNYDYKGRILAAYFNLDKSLGKFYISWGLRGENTVQKGFQYANNGSFKKDYFDLFPSASAQYNLNTIRSVTLSYNRKIARPSFSMMNPFKFYTSPQTYQEGNPDLTPNYISSYSLKYSKKQSYMDHPLNRRI